MANRRAVLWLLSIVAVSPLLFTFALTPLHENKPGGKSIVDFELAGSVARADAILSTWRAEGVLERAKTIQMIDFVYPFIYASALAGCCFAASDAWRRAGHAHWARAGFTFAFVAFVACGFDYIENLGLDIALWYHPVAPWPTISAVAATLKFAGIVVTAAYAITGLAAGFVKSGRANA